MNSAEVVSSIVLLILRTRNNFSPVLLQFLCSLIIFIKYPSL
jgi:hypothetical protein